MSYEEFIAERDGYRAKIVADESPEEPYNDGSTPLLRFVGGVSTGRVEQVNITSYVVPDDIIRAAQEFDLDTFGRYLRIFHGATSAETYRPREMGADTFLTFDTAHWREAMGITDEQVATQAARIANMDEWIAYCEGEVYGVVIEKHKPREATRADLDAVRAGSDPSITYDEVLAHANEALANDEDDFEWDEVNAVWGYYGDNYATETARERLNEYAPVA